MLAPTNFRRAAIRAAAAVATFGTLAVAPVFSSSALAESADTAAARATAGCAKYKDPASHAQCVYDALGRATNALKRDTAVQRKRAAEADKRSAEADAHYTDAHAAGLCTDFLIAGVKGGSFSKSAVLTQANGKLTADNACEVARGFGFVRKAEIDRPAIR